MVEEFDTTTAAGFKEHVKRLIKQCDYKKAIEFVNIKIESAVFDDFEFRD